MVEPVTAGVVKSVDEIPAVCVEDDLIAIFRLTSREMRLWRKFPEFIPFPPLPMFMLSKWGFRASKTSFPPSITPGFMIRAWNLFLRAARP